MVLRDFDNLADYALNEQTILASSNYNVRIYTVRNIDTRLCFKCRDVLFVI